jgi:hypothetical protein
LFDRYAKLSEEGKKLRTKIKQKLIKTGKLSEVQIVKEKKVQKTK